MANARNSCKTCGCDPRGCGDQTSLHLHLEIENLQQRLLERENHIVKMETNFLSEAEKFPNGEFVAMLEEVQVWQDKYNRLYESHKKLQKVNQGLEDKLLRVVDKFETEKNSLARDLSTTTRLLAEERAKNSRLLAENERYRNDVNLTIQLLQCKPANFMPQKLDSLPVDLQQKVKMYVSSRRGFCRESTQQTKPEVRTIKVPIPTFPPTAMVYSVNKTIPGSSEKDTSASGNRPVDIVSAAIMAKVLEEREKERSQLQHCETCRCPALNQGIEIVRNQGTQTFFELPMTPLPTPMTSVRSNILLDNVAGFRTGPPTDTKNHASILGPPGTSCRSAVLVHNPRCRNNSASSCDSHKFVGESSGASTETDI